MSAVMATPDSFTVTKNDVLIVDAEGGAGLSQAGGVLANDNGYNDHAQPPPNGGMYDCHLDMTGSLVSGPSHGLLTLNSNGSFTYTPDPDFVGFDSFTYAAALDTATAQAVVGISVTSDGGMGGTTGGSAGGSMGGGTGSPPGESSGGGGTGNPPPVVCPPPVNNTGGSAGGTVGISAVVPSTAEGSSTPGEFKITRSNGVGSLTVAYEVGGTATGGVDYTALGGSVTFAAGMTEIVLPVNSTADDIDEMNETVIVNLLSDPAHYSLGMSTATVTITAPNSPPELSNLHFTLTSLAYGTGTGTLTGTLNDGSNMSGYSIQIDNNPGDGVETVNSTTWVGGPNADFTTWLSVPVGTATILVRAAEMDMNGAVLHSGWMSVPVNAVNTPPVFDDQPTPPNDPLLPAAPGPGALPYRPQFTATVPENTTGPVVTVTAHDNDPGDYVWSYSLANDPTGLFSINPQTGQITLNQSIDYEQLTADGSPPVITLVVCAEDTNGGTAQADVAVTVTDVNEPPVAAPDTYTVNRGETLVVYGKNSDADPKKTDKSVLANDSDVDKGDKQLLTAELVVRPIANDVEKIIFNKDGGFLLKPVANFTGTITFSYKAWDNGNPKLASNVTTVTVNVVQPHEANDDKYTLGELVFEYENGFKKTDAAGNVLRPTIPDLVVQSPGGGGVLTNDTFSFPKIVDLACSGKSSPRSNSLTWSAAPETPDEGYGGFTYIANPDEWIEPVIDAFTNRIIDWRWKPDQISVASPDEDQPGDSFMYTVVGLEGSDTAKVTIIRPIDRIGNWVDKDTNPWGGLALMGGGSDQASAFLSMIAHADGGDFVVLTINSSSNGYNDLIWRLSEKLHDVSVADADPTNDIPILNSVETFVIDSRTAASDPYVYDRVRLAEAVFITGGNQWGYISNWAGTPLESAIMQAVSGQAVIGGTSAGLHVLGGIDYSARPDLDGRPNGGIDSVEALADPTSPLLTFNSEVREDSPATTPENQALRDLNLLPTIPYMSGVITDTHFVERDRMGRFLTFMAWTSLNGLAVDAASAVLVETQDTLTQEKIAKSKFINKVLNPNLNDPMAPPGPYDGVSFVGEAGSAIVVGSGYRADLGGVAYFGTVTGSNIAPDTPFAGSASIHRFTRNSGRFIFSNAWWNGGTSYEVTAVDGVLTAYDAGGRVVDVYSGTA